MKIKNIEKFNEELKEKVKNYDESTLNEWIKDLETQIGNNGLEGFNSYEISRNKTITGRPELISIEVENIFYDDNGSVIDTNIEGWQDNIWYSETVVEIL